MGHCIEVKTTSNPNSNYVPPVCRTMENKRLKAMTDEEEIISLLVEANDKFIKLEKQHPDEYNDFADGIHKCEYVLAMRFTRENYPEIFPKK